MENQDLYKCMMDAIRSKHARGNAIRYFKLPMILLDSQLYGGAIGQFYLLTSALEAAMKNKTSEGNEMITYLTDELGLKPISAGYETDLQQLFGSQWKVKVNIAKSSATEKYICDINNATDVELCSIVFILYGALVVGGGKSTQKKAKKVIKNCDHVLFDISDNMLQSRKNFKGTFRGLGERYPQHFDEFVKNAQRFMGQNNRVVLSVRCLPFWWLKAVGIIGTLAVGVGFVKHRNK